MYKNTVLMAVVMAFMAITASAKVKLHHLIASGMVIQQNTEVRLWGTADAGKTIKVKVSWNNEKYSTKADNSGRWMVKVKSPKASYTPLSITFDDGQPLTIDNVLSGEVWVCAGQSNMEMPVKGFGNCPVDRYNDVVVEATKVKGIHFAKIPSTMSFTPQEDADCKWEVVNAATVGNCSATGYFFARMINRALDIPVGLILANKGGTRVESWLDEANIKQHTDENLDPKAMEKLAYDYYRPMVWGYGTFSPILNYTVHGILFYQGCSNVGYNTDKYAERLALLVKQWRSGFGLGNIPFYFVQIAPYAYNGVDGTQGALLREQQLKAVDLIPNSDIVCTNDCVYPYETQQIHPAQKQKVGERLAGIALNKDYGMKEIMCESPKFKDMTVSNDTCYVHLKDDYYGISRYEDLQGFEVAGADKVFHKANAYYYWTKGIIITCQEVKKPVAVRYCFRDFKIGNVGNQAQLPLFPFRTDQW